LSCGECFGDDVYLTDTSSHSIRYVLKNKHTNETLFVVIVTLMPKNEVEGKHNDDGTVKTGQIEASKPAESIPDTKPNNNDDDVD